MDIHFEIVLPKKEHAKLIMEWRNDPQTLAMSFHSTPKRWEQFFQEFIRTYFTTPELPPLFAWVDGKRVAFLRFHPVSDLRRQRRKCCEVSINVAPKKRGHGIGTAILESIQEWIKRQGYDDLVALIKKENFASKKAFERAGFTHFDTIDKEIEETGTSIAVDRYICSLRDVFRRASTFIIAEAGSNWRIGNAKDDFSQACRLIDAAVDAKCDAIKFQTYRPETLYVKSAGESKYLKKAGIHESIYDLMSKYALPYEMIPKLSSYCKSKKIHLMSTPFSEEDFYAIDPYVDYHKIASYEISHSILIQLAAASGKPTFLSTGASNEDDIAWAVFHYFAHHGKDLTLMQCTAAYPAELEMMNLLAIPFLSKKFGVFAGLSDHSRDPLLAPVAAVALGATAIEKHFTLDRSQKGPDHFFAIELQELKKMVEAIRETEKMLGYFGKEILEEERELFDFARRGIQAIKEIKIGDQFKEGKNISILRPGNRKRGIHPKYLSLLEGKQALRHIPEGDGIQIGDF